MLYRLLIVYSALLLPVLAQTAPQPTPAKLACPPANSQIDDPATFTWTAGSNTPSYRLLLGPTAGSSTNGDTSLISGQKGQLAGLPPGESLYVTLWSYDQSGNPVEPPSSCFIQTQPQQPVVAFKDSPGLTLSGVSLGSFSVTPVPDPSLPLPVAAQACQAQCKQNSGCQGYTFYPVGAGNTVAMCDLKSQIVSSDSSECCLSALKTVTLPAPPPPPPPPPPPSPAPAPGASTKPVTSLKSVTGEWVNQLGAIAKLSQDGNKIKGTYSDPMQPTLSGTLQGTFDGKTLTATLNWKNGADSSHGSLLLTVSPQGGLDGTWTDANGVSGPWTMAKPSRPAR